MKLLLDVVGAVHQSIGILGHHQFLVRGNHENLGCRSSVELISSSAFLQVAIMFVSRASLMPRFSRPFVAPSRIWGAISPTPAVF